MHKRNLPGAATPSAKVASAPAPDGRAATNARRPSGWTQPRSYDRAPRHIVIKPPLTDRIADALGSRAGFVFALGFYAGCLFTAVMAYIWSGALQ